MRSLDALRRLIGLHCLAVPLLCLSSLPVTAAPTAPDKEPVVLSERFFNRFLELYRDDPGALGRFASGMRNLSIEQMRRAVDALDTTHFTYLAPIIVAGHTLSELRGTPLDELSVMAVRGGRLVPIPFQFDEYDSSGLIWIEGTSRSPAGKPGKLDEQDELVFMFRDGGTTTYDPETHGEAEGDILKEIILTPGERSTRYVYLVRGNNRRSDARYIKVDLDEGRIDSTVVGMQFDPKNMTGMHSVSTKVGHYSGQNVFDNLHLSLSTGILNENLRVSLDSRRNIRAMPIAVKEGPVRARLLLRARVWYFGMPTLFNHQFEIVFYEQGMVLPTQFAIESLGAARLFIGLLREPRLEFSVDFHHLDGATVTFDAIYDKNERGVVDGEMSKFEQRMNEHRMPGDWLHLDSNRGWHMFFHNRIAVTEGGLFDQFLDGTDLAMVYNDDLYVHDDHQQHPGNLPRLGFRARGLPEPAVSLLKAAPRLPRSVRTIGDAIYFLADTPDSRGRLEVYDAAASVVLTRLRDEGILATPEAYAEAYISDMSRMRFTGLNREQLGSLMRAAILETVEDIGDIRHGQVLAALVRLAEAEGVNLRKLRHATMDNALWFPAWTGPDGPRGFHHEINNPPQVEIRSLVAQAAADD